jgi:hypothetical protein
MSDLTGILINTVDGPTQATEADLRASGWLPASEVAALIERAVNEGAIAVLAVTGRAMEAQQGGAI